MKLYKLAYMVTAILLAKFFFGFKYVSATVDTPGNAGMLWALCGGALVAFLIGGIAHSFELDKQAGTHATRNAFGIIVVANLPVIISFIVGLGFALAYHEW